MKKLLLLAFIFLLTGCKSTWYEWVPPKDAAGVACVNQCLNNKNSCYARAEQDHKPAYEACENRGLHELALCQDRAQSKYDTCMRASSDNYRSCLRSTGGSATTCKVASCTLDDCTKDTCKKTPDYQNCSNSYSRCYTDCGGKIIKHEE